MATDAEVDTGEPSEDADRRPSDTPHLVNFAIVRGREYLYVVLCKSTVHTPIANDKKGAGGLGKGGTAARGRAEAKEGKQTGIVKLMLVASTAE